MPTMHLNETIDSDISQCVEVHAGRRNVVPVIGMAMRLAKVISRESFFCNYDAGSHSETPQMQYFQDCSI